MERTKELRKLSIEIKEIVDDFEEYMSDKTYFIDMFGDEFNVDSDKLKLIRQYVKEISVIRNEIDLE